MAGKKNKRRAKGDGTIFPTKNGKYKAQVSVGKDANGRDKKVTRTFNTKTEAQEGLKQIQLELAIGRLTVKGNTTIREFAPLWLNNRKSVKPKTFMDYESIIKNIILPKLGNNALGKITVTVVNKFIAELINEGHSPSSVTKYKAVLSNMMNVAVAEEIITRNPVNYSMKIRQNEPTRNAIPKDDLDKIFEEAEKISNDAKTHGNFKGQSAFIYAVLMTAYHTGMRIGEIFALRFENINLENRTVKICENLIEVRNAEGKYGLEIDTPKTKHSIRTIKISRKLCDVLSTINANIDDESDIVFQSKTGGYIAPSNFARVWRKLLRNIGMAGKYKIHEFRHTHATELAAQNKFDPASIRKRLGHSSIQTTLNVYTHAIDKEDENMADYFDNK